MDFLKLTEQRYSCRDYDESRAVEREKLDYILSAARLAPSACNGQPYLISVCEGEAARRVAEATRGVGINNFAKEAPLVLVISERPYTATAALGAKLKKNDYRSLDIGILSAYITSAAFEIGLGSCILGWFDDAAIREICSLEHPVRLVITLGYPKDTVKIPEKKRKSKDELIKFIEG